MAYLIEAGVCIVLLLDIDLLADRISKIIQGIRFKESKGWSKNFGKGALTL